MIMVGYRKKYLTDLFAFLIKFTLSHSHEIFSSVVFFSKSIKIVLNKRKYHKDYKHTC